MWFENLYVDQARLRLGVPLSPMWIASSAVGHEVGVASPPLAGHFYVFGSTCAFLSPFFNNDATSTGGAREGGGGGGKHTTATSTSYYSDCGSSSIESIVFRISFDRVEHVYEEGGGSALRIIAQGSVYKFLMMEESSAVLRALNWLVTHAQHFDDLSEVERSAIMYPEATRKIRTFSQNADSSEYVLQDIDGAIVTNQRLLFATTVVKLSSILMMHLGEEDLKLIISNELVVQLRCSKQRQSLISSVWLASLPVWTDTLERVAEDPQLALKAHVKTLARLHRQFCAIDVSRSGRLSRQDLSFAIGCLFASKTFVNGFFLALDTDGSGTVSLSEFLIGISQLLTGDVTTRIRFTFDMFDSDRSGFLDRDEFNEALIVLTSSGSCEGTSDNMKFAGDALFDMVDTDHSGSITADEFSAAMLHNPQVFSIFRRVGLYDNPDVFRLQFSEEPLTVTSQTWFLTAAIAQTLQCGLYEKRVSLTHREMKSTVSSSSASITTNALVPLTPASFVAVDRMIINVDAVHIAQFGSPWTPHSHHTDGYHVDFNEGALLEVYAPDVFHRLRALHDISLPNFRKSLGIDNFVANMLLGSSTLLKPVKPLYSEVHSFKFMSHDDIYLVRNISKEEKTALILQLPQYMTYLVSNPNTLLQRYLGVFSIYRGESQLHFTVQLNTVRVQTRTMLISFQATNYHVPLPADGIDATELRAPVQLAAGWTEPLLAQAKRDIQYLCSQKLGNFALIAAVPSLPVVVAAAGTTLSAARLAKIDLDDRAATLALVDRASRWSCCSSSTAKQQPTLTLAGDDFDVFHGDAEHDRKQPHRSDQGMIACSSTLESIPACKRVFGRAAHLGGMFFSYHYGVPNAQRVAISFAFVNVLTYVGDASMEYGKQLEQQLEQLLCGDEEQSGPPLRDCTARWYPISTETGSNGTIGVDHSQKALFLVGAHGNVLLSLNLMLHGGHVSFAKSLQSYSQRNRRRLAIRFGLKQVKHFGQKREFTKFCEVFFDSIVAREMFLGEVRSVTSGDGRCGAHVRKIKLLTITWNVGERAPGDMTDLFTIARGNSCDAVAFCAQDCTFPVPGESGAKSCEEYWTNLLSEYLPEYDSVAYASVWSTRSVVFVKKNLSSFVANISKSVTGSFLGNCNAVAIGFTLMGSSICIINARFAERGDNKSSSGNFNDVLEGLSGMEDEGLGLLVAYHHIIFCGDLKYRSEASLDEVIQTAHDADEAMRNSEGGMDSSPLSVEGKCDTVTTDDMARVSSLTSASASVRAFQRLAATDQLCREMSSGETHCGFVEAPVRFRPTNKLLIGSSDCGDSGKKQNVKLRVYDSWGSDEAPGWSHRILYRSLGHPIDEGVCLDYDANLTVPSSPCAPVFAVHELGIRVQVVTETSPTNMVYGLKLSLMQCSQFVDTEFAELCNPWVQCFSPYFSQPSSLTRTDLQYGTVTPRWPGPLLFPCVPCDRTLLVSDYLVFGVFDEEDGGRRKFRGAATVSMDCLAHLDKSEVEVPLYQHGRRSGVLTATIELVLQRPSTVVSSSVLLQGPSS